LAEKLFREKPEVYKDPNYKPEMAITLTDFEALSNFASYEEVSYFL
jgi:mannose-6-phosphate isomerase